MYFSNSHDEPRLADAGDAGDRDELRLPSSAERVEQLLDEPELAVAADERRLEARRPHAPRARRRPPAAPARAATGSALPFSSWLPASS